MSDSINLISEYLNTPILRILTCGSVDDGKSTFLGRLLLDSGNVYMDHLRSFQKTSRKLNGAYEEPELAYLIDGLKAEIEQGITIDVSYRYFFTRRRKFIVADAPGHAQYTRNMAVAASNSDAAVLLIDGSSGIKVQTKRHLSILSLMKVDHIIVAVNKMDLVDFKEDRFAEVRDETLGTINSIYDHPCSYDFVPISSKKGDNVVAPSQNMTWYSGKTVLELLESMNLEEGSSLSFCLPIQYVAHEADRRCYAGTVISGSLTVGDELTVLPSGVRTRVSRITVSGRSSGKAKRRDPVMVELADDIDISRGDKLIKSEAGLRHGDTISCRFFWFSERPMGTGDIYELKFLSRKVRATVQEVKARLDLDHLEQKPATCLARNEIGLGSLTLSAEHYCLPFGESKDLGRFLIVDMATGDTVGLGTILKVQEAGRLYPYETMIDKSMRASLKNQHPMLIWLTGLSGSGKSTIANLLEQRMYEQGYHTYLLDGDILRNGLNKDLGFDAASRKENIRRAGEVARLMVDAGIIVIASFISPFTADRAFVRSLFKEGEFCEVYVDAPLEECIRRDPKGLYARALSGEISEFTGINSPYEPPVDAEIRIDTSACSPHEAVNTILERLAED